MKLTLLPAALVFLFLMAACGRRDRKTGETIVIQEPAEVKAAREDFIARREAEQKDYSEVFAAMDANSEKPLPQSKLNGKLHETLESFYRTDISMVRSEAEVFQRRRIKQWDRMYQEWEGKKWAG